MRHFYQIEWNEKHRKNEKKTEREWKNELEREKQSLFVVRHWASQGISLTICDAH